VNDRRTSVGRLILMPALITLAITLLRLAGELLGWSPRLFNRAAGGGGAIVGIVWLVPVLGVYFAVRLAREGQRPAGAGRAVGYALGALALVFAIGIGAGRLGLARNAVILAWCLASLAAVFVAFAGWPALGRTLVAYGLAARIPVAIVMLVAILGAWGTHYDVAPPNFPEMAPLAKWFWIGLVPQLTLWMAFTVVIGMLFGAVAAALVRPRTA